MSFVAGVGKINIDLIFSGLRRLPKEGEELYAERFDMCLGGGTPGTLINLAGLGVPVKLMTALGTDIFSEFAAGEIKKRNIEIKNTYKGSGLPLNITAAAVTPSDRTFLSYGEDGQDCGEALLDMCMDAKYVIMDGRHLPFYKKLKEAGVKLVMDFGWEEDLSLDKYEEYFKIADYYLPNRKEALLVTGKADYREAAVVLSRYFKDVIIKLDSQGCYIYSEGRGRVIPEIKSFVRVDSTGAGDAFLAGFLYGLYNGYSLEKSVVAGNLTGGRCVTGIGCLTECFDRAGLEAELDNYFAANT